MLSWGVLQQQLCSDKNNTYLKLWLVATNGSGDIIVYVLGRTSRVRILIIIIKVREKKNVFFCDWTALSLSAVGECRPYAFIISYLCNTRTRLGPSFRLALAASGTTVTLAFIDEIDTHILVSNWKSLKVCRGWQENYPSQLSFSFPWESFRWAPNMLFVLAHGNSRSFQCYQTLSKARVELWGVLQPRPPLFRTFCLPVLSIHYLCKAAVGIFAHEYANLLALRSGGTIANEV